MLGDYETHTETRYKDPQGLLHDPYLDRFYREPTAEEKKQFSPLCGSGCGHGISWSSRDWGDGLGYRPKVHFVPNGWEETEVLTKDVQTVADWLRDWHEIPIVKANQTITENCKRGYAVIDDDGNVTKVIRRTNPNAKWDWWTIGGRYSNKFSSGAVVDQIRFADIDHEELKTKAIKQREDWVLDIMNETHSTREEVAIACRLSPIEHKEWQELPNPKPRGAEYIKWLEEKGGDYSVLAKVKSKTCDIPDVPENQTLDEWIQAAPLIAAFAYVRNGEWNERGEMGWWACVSNEKDELAWDQEVAGLFTNFDDDDWVTCVDCHI